jgi:hypothetical protein
MSDDSIAVNEPEQSDIEGGRGYDSFTSGMLAWPTLGGFIGAMVFIGSALLQHRLEWTRGAAFCVAGGGLLAATLALAHTTQLFGRRLLSELRTEGLRFERHWGGLGGASTGWQVSRSLALLIAFALSLGGLLAVLRTAQSFAESMLDEDSPPKRSVPAAAASSAAPAASAAGGRAE